jgi:hypothetical protein
MKKKSLSSIIQNAVEKKRIEVAFSITIDGEVVDLLMRGVDDFYFQSQRDLLEQSLRAEAVRMELVGSPLAEEEWKAFLAEKSEDDRKIFEQEGMPRDRAEFYIMKNLGQGMLFKLVPKCLFTKDGARLIETPEEYENFTELMRRDPGIASTIIKNYVQLSKKIKETRQAVKNSSNPASVKSGLSGENSQECTPNMEAHSRQS